MNVMQAFREVLLTIADIVGVPRCNTDAQHRMQGDGKLQVAVPNGAPIAISGMYPKSGYIRWENMPTSERYERVCEAYRYSANFAVVLWEQGGDVSILLTNADSLLKKYNFRALGLPLVVVKTTKMYSTYEEIMANEHGLELSNMPTQAGLAVVRIDVSIDIVLIGCQMSAILCPPAVPPPPPLPDALTLYFTNTGITSPAMKAAITTFYTTASTRSYFPKLKAIHPLAGGNANAHKYNLLDARDADDAYRLTFFGGWIHGANGSAGNGINAWANTHFSETNSPNNSWNFGYYSRTNTGNIQWCDMGSFDGVRGSNIFPRVTIITTDRMYLRHGSAGGEFTAGATRTDGFYQCNRVDTVNIRARVRGALVIQPTPYIGKNNLEYSLGSLNNNLVQQFYSAREYGLVFAAEEGFTDVETLDFHNDVTALMVALGRAV